MKKALFWHCQLSCKLGVLLFLLLGKPVLQPTIVCAKELSPSRVSSGNGTRQTTPLSWEADTNTTSTTLPNQLVQDVSFYCYVQAPRAAQQLQVKVGEQLVATVAVLAASAQQALVISQQALQPGDNLLTVTLMENGVVQAVITGTVYVEAFLLQTVPSALRWTIPAEQTYGDLSRDAGNTLTLAVLDSRKTRSPWQISATVETRPNDTPPFYVVWKADDGAVRKLDETVVMRSEATDNQQYITSKTWSESAGVLIHADHYLPIQNYSGHADDSDSDPITVTWNLTDVVATT